MKIQNTLQCDDPKRMALTCPINNTHTAASDFFQDLIVSDAPIGIVNVNFIEHLLECLRSFRFGVEAAEEHAMQAKAAFHDRCCPTLRACYGTGLNSRRPGNVARAHRSITRRQPPEPRR